MDRWIRRIVGSLQIGGGFFGIVVLGAEVLRRSAGETALVLAALGLLAFGLCAGIALIEGSRWGRRASVVWWWLQLPIFWSPLIAFNIWSGVFLSFYIKLTGFKIGFDLYFGAAFDFAFFHDKPWLVGINLFAAFMLYLLDVFVHDPVVESRETPPAIEPRPTLAERVEAGRIAAGQPASTENP